MTSRPPIIRTTRSPEWIALVRNLTAEGKSSTEMAYVMDTTRNVIIAQCRRHGIELGQVPRRPPAGGGWKAPKPGKARNNNPTGITAAKVQRARPRLPGLPATPPCQRRVAMNDAGSRHCRYIGELPPVITAATPLYCGERTAERSSWCAAHAAVVFNADARPARMPAWAFK